MIRRHAILLIWICGLAASLGAETPQLRWAAVEGAGAYLVEIRSGTQIVSATVESPSFDLALKPGEYAVRITTLDKFLKPAARTDWTGFIVAPTVTPTITSVTPSETKPGPSRFTITGSGFSSSTDVLLQEGSETVTILQKRVSSNRELEFSVELKPGVYSLVLSNPPHQRATMGQAIVVSQPVLTPTPTPDPMTMTMPQPTPTPEPVHPTVMIDATPPKSPLQVGAGYQILVPFGPWSQVLKTSFQGAQAFAQWPLWPTVGPLIRLDYTGFDSRVETSRLNIGGVSAGAFWDVGNIPATSIPVRLLLAPGLMFTQAAAETGKAASLDFSVDTGAMLTFSITDSLFGMVGTNYRVLLYSGTPLQSFGLSVGTGTRF